VTERPGTARFTRQIRLDEVGDDGQARLAAARPSLRGSGVSRLVEERYLAGAGVTLVAPHADMEEATSSLPSWVSLLDPAARDVAAGAFSALTTIKRILERGRSPR
jgi:hypothetical protein